MNIKELPEIESKFATTYLQISKEDESKLDIVTILLLIEVAVALLKYCIRKSGKKKINFSIKNPDLDRRKMIRRRFKTFKEEQKELYTNTLLHLADNCTKEELDKFLNEKAHK